jgi:hypothetical protein
MKMMTTLEHITEADTCKRYVCQHVTITKPGHMFFGKKGVVTGISMIKSDDGDIRLLINFGGHFTYGFERCWLAGLSD